MSLHLKGSLTIMILAIVPFRYKKWSNNFDEKGDYGDTSAYQLFIYINDFSQYFLFAKVKQEKYEIMRH